jgi:hypothetical protein
MLFVQLNSDGAAHEVSTTSRYSLCENSGFSAPKARNVIAQGNALGKGHDNPGSAEGAK